MSVFTCDELAYICNTLYEQMCLSMQVVVTYQFSHPCRGPNVNFDCLNNFSTH